MFLSSINCSFNKMLLKSLKVSQFLEGRSVNVKNNIRINLTLDQILPYLIKKLLKFLLICHFKMRKVIIGSIKSFV